MRNHDGFTLIELVIVTSVVTVLSAIALPGLNSARMAGNEASAIGSLRAVRNAEETFAAACGRGGYAASLEVLAARPTAAPDSPEFISADLAAASTTGPAAPKSGYLFTVTGTNDTIAAGGSGVCNGTSEDTMSGYFVQGDPQDGGWSGRRHFASDPSGEIRQDHRQLASMAAGVPLQ